MNSPALGNALDTAQEFVFTDEHFDLLRQLVKQYAGISLNDTKRQLVYGRLARRIRVMNLPGFDDYCALVRNEDSTEIESFINAITTNLTSFFRESHHFDYLAQQVVPTLLQQNAASRRIRIWSAGCSSGEEPYSIAMTLLDALGSHCDWDIKVLATDIDSNMVATAAAGIFPPNRQQGLSDAHLRRWFVSAGGGSHNLRVKDEIRRLIRFAPLNLVAHWPFRGPFDAVFCRNVVIYFDKQTQSQLFTRYADVLAGHGYLFIGHSETMLGTCTRFDLIGRTTYRLAHSS